MHVRFGCCALSVCKVWFGSTLTLRKKNGKVWTKSGGYFTIGMSCVIHGFCPVRTPENKYEFWTKSGGCITTRMSIASHGFCPVRTPEKQCKVWTKSRGYFTIRMSTFNPQIVSSSDHPPEKKCKIWTKFGVYLL
jgi:hypothetical protein